MFKKSRIARGRDVGLSIGLLLVSAHLVLEAFQSQGHETICLILQISASAVLLAAGGLSLFLLSSPTLCINKLGIGERDHLLSDLNWDMTWNEIAYAELVDKMGRRVRLIGMDSEAVEHTLAGYEHFEMILAQLEQGLKKYGRRLIEAGETLPVQHSKNSKQ